MFNNSGFNNIISIGTGTIPSNNGFLEIKNNYIDIDKQMSNQDSFNPITSGIQGRSWTNTNEYIPFIDNNSPPLESGNPDLSDEINMSFSNENTKNKKYNVLSKAHPTDIIGSAIYKLSNDYIKKINPSSSYNPSSSSKEINMQYIDYKEPSYPIQKMSKYEKQYQTDNNKNEKNKNKNKKIKNPININISCNQGKNTDEYGYTYSGYGSPTLNNQCQNVEGNNSNNSNTLRSWYGDQSVGNNVFRRRNQWYGRDYNKESLMSTQSNMSIGNELISNTISLPYSPYSTYSTY